ncbi:T9SS type A sorting domain-containing protein [Pedobacter antarcticus]|uniref:T9SS type A sorting domain-containing protein n=1 Tax=Pedobacter antarcticus TaxID=34086 RepID=UPI000942BD89|nr:T9SS type A sorting domain-containing protein [Pedobacter antarcticus]
MSVLCSVSVFAQRSDSISNNAKYKRIVKTPQIKGDVPSYKPSYMPGSSFNPNNSVVSSNKQNGKQDKILSVMRVYPNPVDDQINLTIRLERESNLTIKIMDLLGNEVVTLSNERLSAGEQTKTFTIPNRLNSGIYFLRFVAGSETVVKRISVL